nr:hypothetical protein [Tanacetum cinerariifolium]
MDDNGSGLVMVARKCSIEEEDEVPLVDGVLKGALSAFGERGLCFGDRLLKWKFEKMPWKCLRLKMNKEDDDLERKTRSFEHEHVVLASTGHLENCYHRQDLHKWGFTAALAVLITRESQSRQHVPVEEKMEYIRKETSQYHDQCNLQAAEGKKGDEEPQKVCDDATWVGVKDSLGDYDEV